jgi:hypothetical protein
MLMNSMHCGRIFNLKLLKIIQVYMVVQFLEEGNIEMVIPEKNTLQAWPENRI